jgi:hypothetical protein
MMMGKKKTREGKQTKKNQHMLITNWVLIAREFELQFWKKEEKVIILMANNKPQN